MKLVVNILVTQIVMAKDMARVHLLLLMDLHTMAHGIMVKERATVSLDREMEQFMKVNGQMIRKMVLVVLHFLVVLRYHAIGLMIRKTEEEQ